MVRAGEKGGVLEQTLRRLAALLSALIYPTLLAAVGGAAVIFLMTFVIPRFADIFRDLGSAIPLPTQVLLVISAWIRTYWWALAGAALAVALTVRVWVASPRGRLQADRLLLSLPVLGPLTLETEMARFARITGTLLKSGVPMLGALAVVREMMGNKVLAHAVDRLGEGVRGGAGLSKPMADSRIFPVLAIHMVKVGEETG